MSVNRPAAGGGREILVAAGRAVRWIDGFDARHRITTAVPTAHGLRITAADGSVADCALPLGATMPPAEPGADSWTAIERFGELARRPVRVGVVFARRAAVAVGRFDGARLVESKVDKSYVQGRTAAGGWSQQRYQRRRGNQADHAAGKAADLVNRLLVPVVDRLAAVVTAGDREAVAAILADRRLSGLADRAVSPHIGDVGEPRLASLTALPDRFWVIRIHLTEPVGT